MHGTLHEYGSPKKCVETCSPSGSVTRKGRKPVPIRAHSLARDSRVMSELKFK